MKCVRKTYGGGPLRYDPMFRPSSPAHLTGLALRTLHPSWCGIARCWSCRLIEEMILLNVAGRIVLGLQLQDWLWP